MSDLMTVQEVADAFRVSGSTVHRWAEDGVIPAIRIGGSKAKVGVIRFRRSDVEKLLSPEPPVEPAEAAS